jgi:hypothetical protein
MIGRGEYINQPLRLVIFLTQPTSLTANPKIAGQAVRRMIISIKAKQTSIIRSRSRKNRSRAIIQRHSC